MKEVRVSLGSRASIAVCVGAILALSGVVHAFSPPADASVPALLLDDAQTPLDGQISGDGTAPVDRQAPADATVSLRDPHESPQDAEPLPPVVGPPRPGAELDPDLQWLRSILQNPANAPEVRLGAAQRIVSRGSSDALRIVDEALRSGDPGQIEAVTSALDDEGRTRPSTLDALISALATSPRELHARIARLLSREGDAAAERVAQMALDASRPPSERLGAIFVLGQLRGRDPVPDLMTLLDEKRREPPEILRESCESLERATGQRLGVTPDVWRQWWAARRASPSQEVVIAGLREQLLQLQKQIDLEAERSTKLGNRLRQAYIDLLPTLPAPERSERIAALLDDELPDVRNMGLGQVERVLRNGERPSDAVMARVMDRLTDRVPSIRIRAMRLLDDLGAPRLAERVAEILPAESDPGAAEAMLRLLAIRPIPLAFGPTAARLQEPALAEVAAMAVNRIADAGMAPSGWESDVIDEVRAALEGRVTPELVRLRAVAGNDADRDAVTALLANAEEPVRLGAAEGLRRSGRRRALLERADADPAIYAVAIASIADQPAAPAVVASLLDLPPKSEQTAAWNTQMQRVLVALPPRDALAADERLRPLAFVDPAVREAGLRAALAAPMNGGDGALRVDVLARLADLLMDKGDARGALRLLTADGVERGDAIRPRLFRAAVLEGEYDLAAGIESAAERWISLLEAIAPAVPRSARPLADEILLRFGRTLSDAERARVTAVERTLGAVSAGG